MAVEEKAVELASHFIQLEEGREKVEGNARVIYDNVSWTEGSFWRKFKTFFLFLCLSTKFGNWFLETKAIYYTLIAAAAAAGDKAG